MAGSGEGHGEGHGEGPQGLDRRAHALFDRALSLPADERHGWVEREAADDPALRERVLALLRHADSPTLDIAARLQPDSQLDSQPAQRPEQIGPYRILDELGEGGMGTVYLAEQQQPVKRRVALKLIKLGMDSKAVVSRFEQERQALALMDHEGIAKVYDCGTSERGQPYFAMELVKGIPLDEFCERQQLSLKDRILLMKQVCSAVQHAHHKGVVHRDLKPGNVLVSDDGGRLQVKIIDFGLAKAMGQRLVEATLFTEVGTTVGTPEYMAPEQADPTNQDIDTRADVYSLGVMLYEVLCGQLPFPGAELRAQGLLEMRRILREVDPPKPSTKITRLGDSAVEVARARRVSLPALKKALSGDLDWVVLKALEKERNRRYETANALAADLQRYLDHEPLVAGPPSAAYRLKKLVRRYRGQVVAGALVVATAVIGAVIAINYAVIAGENEQRAVASEQEAERRAEENAKLAEEKSALADAERAAKAEVQRTVDNFNQLSAVVRLRDALAKQDALWPAWPEQIEGLRSWLANDCEPLLGQRAQIEATIAELRQRALPWDDATRQQDLESHPEHAEWLHLGKVRQAMRHAAVVATGDPRSDPALTEDLLALDADHVHDLAWPRVDPDRDADGIFGEEALGLALARRVVALLDSGDTTMSRCSALDTLAWALLANGRFDEARATAEQAVQAVAEDGEHKQQHRRDADRLAELVANFHDRLQGVEARWSALDAKVSERRTWTFGSDEESRSAEFLHNALVDVLAGLGSMEAKEQADVAQRLTWAEQVEAASITKYRDRWAEARRAILRADGVTASELYRDAQIDLPPQMGLVPIGMNPKTKLWEFYELRSAWDGESDPASIEIPTHRENGSIEVKAGIGIVFVLLPGGRVTLGSQKDDQDAPYYDPQHESDETIHEVTLSPFFLARHELTRAQWQRLAGDQLTGWNEGSRYEGDRIAIGRMHPADSMDWDAADRWMTRHGMALPTEAQWEYGARGGTTTVFWPGQSAADLQDCANVHDKTSFERYPQWGEPAPITDGFRAIAPVGSFQANAFGLYDVHGNVWEWCRDWYGDYGSERAGDGLRSGSPPANRVYRGGSFSGAAVYARSAFRNRYAPSIRSYNLGLRPARIITF